MGFFPIRYIGLIVFIWGIAAFFGACLQGILPFQGADPQMQDIKIVENFQVSNTNQVWGPVGFVAPLVGFFEALYRILLFQYPFITGSWVIVKWLVLGPLLATVVFGLVVLFISMFTKAL